MRKVPVRMPTKSEEITSLINKAITIATIGGRIDIQSGIGAEAGPKTYSNTSPNTRANATIKPIHFFFIAHKMKPKNTIF